MSDFGDAVQEMREGGKVRRQGWKGKWLELDDTGMIFFKSDQGYRAPWLAIKSEDAKISEDLLADDWEGID